VPPSALAEVRLDTLGAGAKKRRTAIGGVAWTQH
jgi:hypothetical protein